jgi:hypothetical protein
MRKLFTVAPNMLDFLLLMGLVALGTSILVRP